MTHHPADAASGEFHADEIEAMRRALTLAARGEGWVEPNPMVGAVVLQAGRVVGEGYHERFGGPHAEVHALDQAGEQARDGTLVVTLEPCCHHGKTPPCTERILTSGVRRVVVAMRDPFPLVAGGGLRQLQEAGIEVRMGCLESEAARLNAPYRTLLTLGRPYIHAKWAMTLDGKIATITGASQWISGEEARAHAHAFRGRMDAILVGIGTVLADDPLLTARPPGPRVALRVVLDANARTPAGSQLVRTAREIPTLVAVGAIEIADPVADGGLAERIESLRVAGCEILECPHVNGRLELTALLRDLGQRRMTNLLVEGGSLVLGGLADAGLVDAVRIYVGPMLFGGREAPGPVAGQGFAALPDALRFHMHSPEMLGDTLFYHGERLDPPISLANR